MRMRKHMNSCPAPGHAFACTAHAQQEPRTTRQSRAGRPGRPRAGQRRQAVRALVGHGAPGAAAVAPEHQAAAQQLRGGRARGVQVRNNRERVPGRLCQLYQLRCPTCLPSPGLQLADSGAASLLAEQRLPTAPAQLRY